MKQLRIFTIIVLTLINTNLFGQNDLENEIISALIKSEIRSLPNDTIFTRKGKIKKIKTYKVPDVILVNETEIFQVDPNVNSFVSYKNDLRSLNNDSYQDFVTKNKTKVPIDSIRDFNGTIRYISNQDVETIFKQGGWGNYHKTYGFKSLIKISRPGLNNDKTKAFIYYSSSEYELGGAGFYVMLEKVNNKWIVKESKLAWIS